MTQKIFNIQLTVNKDLDESEMTEILNESLMEIDEQSFLILINMLKDVKVISNE